jgi:hypothetical protein
VTVIDGACWYQLAIRDDTCGPEPKSTRSQPVPDHVCTECPGGAQGFAQPACSSVVQTPDQFMDTLGAY